MRYRVEAQQTVFTTYVVEADSKEEAQILTENGEAPSPQNEIGEDFTVINVWESEK